VARNRVIVPAFPKERVVKTVSIAALLCAGLLLTACDRANDLAQADPNDPVARHAGVASVFITGNDQMRYNITAFTVHPGEKVRVMFENTGKMPVNVMGHDLVILKAGENYQAFANAAASNGSLDDGYLPPDATEQVFAHTKVLGPGEKQTLSFTAPAAGEYDYLCTFPGHFAFMHGIMTVK
jgi:azurin